MGMKKFKMLNYICASCELSSKEKLVAQYFIYKSNKSGECYPAVNSIARNCGVSERTIQRATKKLQQEGFITIEHRYVEGKQTSNLYKINMLLIEEIEREKECESEEKSNNIKAEANPFVSEINLEDVISLGSNIDSEYLKQIYSDTEYNTELRVDDNNESVDLNEVNDSVTMIEYDYDLLDSSITTITTIDSQDDSIEISHNDAVEDNILIDQDTRISDYIEKGKESNNYEEKTFSLWRKEYLLSNRLNLNCRAMETERFTVNQTSTYIDKIKINKVVIGVKKIAWDKIVMKYVHNKKEKLATIKLDRDQVNVFWKCYIKYGDLENDINLFKSKQERQICNRI